MYAIFCSLQNVHCFACKNQLICLGAIFAGMGTFGHADVDNPLFLGRVLEVVDWSQVHKTKNTHSQTSANLQKGLPKTNC